MGLHLGEPQIEIGIVFGAIALFLAITAAVIAFHAGSEVDDEVVHARGYWLRKRFLAGVIVLGVALVGITLLDLPYASGGSTTKWTAVRVTGGQFFWEITPDTVPAGAHVRFDVGSIDVNHGFGIYDPHGHFIGSVQAMPGFHNLLDLTLSEPGVYRIRCMEYCGIGHTDMLNTFTVSAS